MDTDTARLWLQIVNMLGTFALGVWLYLEKRSDKTNEKVQTLSDDVEALAREVTTIKAAAENAPDHHDLAKVYEGLNKVSELVHRMAGESRSQSETLRLILHRIMEKGM